MAGRSFLGVLAAVLISGIGWQAYGEEGLVAYWKFDEGQGNVAKDSSGNHHDAALKGATWTEGKFGGALKFDGKSYVDCGASEALKFAGSFTLDLWERHAKTLKWQTLISDQVGSEFGCGLDLLNGNTYAPTTIGAAPADPASVYVEGTCAADDAWRHAVMVYDASAGTIAIYVDGARKMMQNVSGQLRKSPRNLMIGVYPGEMSQWFTGAVDEVKVYNRALTAEEIGKDAAGPVAQANPAGATPGVDAGLAAYYPFDEGTGSVARDRSGHGLDAKIVGCLYVKSDRGFALDFNGIGNNPTNHVVVPDIKLTGGLTLSAWVYAYQWSSDQWSGLVYKSDATFGIRNYPKRPGAIHFRIDSQDLISATQLKPRQWYHVAAVFSPGKYMRIYINGRLDARLPSLESAGGHIPDAIPTDASPLLIGACGSQCFAGRLDEVRIYDRALEPDEVRAVYVADGGEASPAAQEEIARPVLTLKKEGCEVRILPRGGMEVVSNGETWRVASSFSAAGGNHNLFSLAASAGGGEEEGWSPQAVKKDDASGQIVAQGRGYQLTRVVTLAADKVSVSDTFTNVSGGDVGIVQWHRLSAAQPFEHWFLYGVENATGAQDPRTPAINPTCFIPQGKASLGVVVEDDILRNQLEGSVSPDLRMAELGTRHFGLPKGTSCTTSFTFCLGDGDYFDFINRVRADWKVPQVTVPGPCAFLRTASFESDFYRTEMAPHPERFKAFLNRKNIKLFMICPWFKYWDGFDFSDADFKKTAQDAMNTVRRVEPEAKFLACLETYYYFVPRSILGDTVPQRWEEWAKMPYEFSLSPAATKIIAGGPWKDSVYRDPEGNVKVSRGDPGPDANYKTPPLCLDVYPETGNYYSALRMSQINYLLDDVGFDGVYMDMFGYGGDNYTYEKWDGHTVDIGADGEITRKYANLALVTAPARKAWLENVISKGKIALVNFGQPNTRALQTVPYLSFVEGADIGHVDLAAAIPDSSGAAGCQLSAPVSLAAGPGDNAGNEMARVRAFLRYGVLYYHYYSKTLFPEQGAGSGEYGPINHMFPITPVRLGKGFIIGKERIITTVSRDFVWKGEKQPRVLLFDKIGKDKPQGIAPQKTDQGWLVSVKLDDWHDIAVIEE